MSDLFIRKLSIFAVTLVKNSRNLHTRIDVLLSTVFFVFSLRLIHVLSIFLIFFERYFKYQDYRSLSAGCLI